MRWPLHTILATALLVNSLEGVADSVSMVASTDSGSTHELHFQHAPGPEAQSEHGHEHEHDQKHEHDQDDESHAHVCHCSAHAPSIAIGWVARIDWSRDSWDAVYDSTHPSLTKPPPLPPPIS